MHPEDFVPRLDRRDALKWLASAVAALPTLRSLGATTNIVTAAGTLTDPDLQKPVVPWARTFTREELRTATVLCDTIIPADYHGAATVPSPMPPQVGSWFLTHPPTLPKPGSPGHAAGVAWLDALSQERFRKNFAELADDQRRQLGDDISPSASQVKVPDFLDEWISAPYPEHQADKQQIRDGLKWLNSDATQRFRKPFAELSDTQIAALCDDICFVPKAKAEFKVAAEFFAKARDLTAAGYYTTKPGMKDLRYVGNVPLQSFRGPPPEVLEHLKLA